MQQVDFAPCSAAIRRAANDLLVILLVQVEVFGEWDGAPGWPDAELHAMRSIGIPYKPSVWFDDRTPARRMLHSRAARYLEQNWLVDRITERHRNRVQYIVFRQAGLKQALDAAGPSADRDLIARGLELTTWGGRLIKATLPSYVEEPVDDLDCHLLDIEWPTDSDVAFDEPTAPSTY